MAGKTWHLGIKCMGNNLLKKNNMKSTKLNIITTLESSELQRSSEVCGSSVQIGINLADLLHPSSNNREDVGVGNQAPAILSSTSAVANMTRVLIRHVTTWRSLGWKERRLPHR